MIQVFLSGEGANDLGGWHRERPHREKQPYLGVLEALALHVAPTGWKIRDAMNWKSIPKLRRGSLEEAGYRTVLGLHQHAKERGCSVLLFACDRDGSKPPNIAHQRGINKAMDELRDSDVSVAGGVCIECLESWLLAIAGRTKTEDMSKTRAQAELGLAKDTAAMVALVERHGVDDVPDDAESLRAWLACVETSLGQHDESSP